MPTQPRVPGAASSEVDFELERFERTREDRIEISGRWYGLRGRRFVRPVLNLHTAGGSRRRAIALLEHKPWAADDGETWLAAFAWPPGAGEVEGAELEVGPGLVVDLPAPGGKPGSQGRVSALRPHAPAPMARRIAPVEEPGADAPAGERGEREDVPRDRGEHAGSDRAPARDRETVRGRGEGSGFARDRDGRAGRVEIWDTEPPRQRTSPPPLRDVRTAALEERDEAFAARDDAERERIQALNDRDDALSRRDAALRDVDRAVAERDEAVAERERLAAELERVTRERDVADAERKRMMQDAEAVARERDQAAAERDAARSELSRALPERDQALREAEAAGARADRAESERETAFAERKTAVAQRDRARRERDRAMRAAGAEPPVESPFVGSAAAPADSGAVPPSASPAAGVDDGGRNGAAGTGDASARRGAAAVGDAAARSGDPGVGHSEGEPGAAAAGDVVGRGGDPGAGHAEGEPGAVAAGDAASPAGAAGASDADGPAGAAHVGDANLVGMGAATVSPPGTPVPSRPMKRIGVAPIGATPEPKPLLTPVDAGRPRRLSRTRRPPSAPVRWAVRIVVMLVLIAVIVVLAILLASVV
jgi:hypothetical protein